MSSHTAQWVPMSTAPGFRRAQVEILLAARRDCEVSSASREAFGAHLAAFEEAKANLKTLPHPAPEELPHISREYDIYVSSAWRDTFSALVEEIRRDCMASSASSELYGPLLTRLDVETAELERRAALTDAIDRVAAFLKGGHAIDYAIATGKIDEKTLFTVLKDAVDTHDTPRVAPLIWEAKGNGIEWAHTPFGVYEIVDFGAKGYLLQFGIGASSFLVHEKPSPTRDHAADVARLDYTRRIKNSMNPPAQAKRLAVDRAIVLGQAAQSRAETATEPGRQNVAQATPASAPRRARP